MLALVENTAKNVAKCNTDGGEGSIVVKLVDDDNATGTFERKLKVGVLVKIFLAVMLGRIFLTFEAELQANIQFWNTYAASLIW